jgi:D-glycero-D-manno-heptose 1,7-bisphosphate phosphatase
MEPRLIIFDADGTLRYCNVEGQPCPNRDGEWELYPGVAGKLSRFRWSGPGDGDGDGTGYGIASNQGGVGVGYFSLETAMGLLEDTFREAFGFPPEPGTVQICPHHPRSGCQCRKPNPLMLNRLMDLYGVTADRVLFVGDMEADREAAENAGCDFEWAWDFFERDPE